MGGKQASGRRWWPEHCARYVHCMDSATAVSARSAFAHRDFRLYQGARLFMTLGVQMQSVAVGWHVYSLTQRPLDLGYVGLAQFLPMPWSVAGDGRHGGSA